jgi:ribosomal protein S12 methylthiotransferase accessory factor
VKKLLVNNAIHFRGRAYQASKQYCYSMQRSCSPWETLEKVRPYFKSVGLTRLADITGLDRIGIPVVLAIRPNSPTLSNTSGKGFTLEAALASAAMEAIEVYHAETIGSPVLHLSYEQLRQDYQMIPAENLLLTKDSLFNAKLAERWVLGWDIVNQIEVPVPLVMVDLVPKDWRRPSEFMSFQMGSNGLASGNHLIEAICSGLYEVVERDAVACQRVAWETCGRPIPRVKLETIESPLVIELLDRFRAAQVKPVLFDCTVDTQVPTYMAYIYDEVSRHIGVYRGYGAHLDPEIAMVRALTEAAQARLIYTAGSRDDLFHRHHLQFKKNDNQAAIRSLESIPTTVDAQDRESEAMPTFEEDIQVMIEKLGQVGLHQVIVLDLTRPGFNVSAVRVVVPGLEGYMFAYYTPGRRALAFYRGKEQ